jgi:enoyl-CoA hydratase/carnithine racemase
MSDAVLFEQTGHIGRITLNRPDGRNCMTGELLDAFGKATAAARRSDVRCVIVTGKGRCFSAGADLNIDLQREGASRSMAPHERSYAMYEPFLSLLDIEVPVIGALNGHAVGGGFGLALVCDMRIANKDAKYGANFAKLGLHPGMAVSWFLPRLVGVPRAAELLFTGKLVKGAEGERIGLFNRAVEAADVASVAEELANDIASSAPIAVRMMKRTFYEGINWDPRSAAYKEAWAQAATLDTADAKEGINALLGKRKPAFSGV